MGKFSEWIQTLKGYVLKAIEWIGEACAILSAPVLAVGIVKAVLGAPSLITIFFGIALYALCGAIDRSFHVLKKHQII